MFITAVCFLSHEIKKTEKKKIFSDIARLKKEF